MVANQCRSWCGVRPGPRRRDIFFGDVVAAAVPGKAARKVVSGLFCFEVGEEFMVGWDDPGVAALAGNVKPSIGVVLGVESSDF